MFAKGYKNFKKMSGDIYVPFNGEVMKMRDHAIYTAIAILGLALLVFSGCASMMMVNERAISLEDIVNLSKAELSSDVIISHIDATNSIFKLTSDDIIRLKEEGVDDDVIEYIIESDIDSERFGWMNNTSPYDYWSYYSSSYYYPTYDYYFNRNSGYRYNYPYSYYPYSSYYNRPYFNYNYGGLSYYRNPYYVRRTPGLVGRFYEYAPSVPVYERDYYPDRRMQRRDSGGRDIDSDENDDSRGSRDNGAGIRIQRRDRDDNSSRRREPDTNDRSGRSR